MLATRSAEDVALTSSQVVAAPIFAMRFRAADAVVKLRSLVTL